ncbi:uncharacterized protein LOC121739279 [Aricia agestis]|uniref:uncharacterized protein LOC121739279 n=1 Tax=Aricia agestis TaxID=91739 RepID=UPI001C206B70|nr:uncharacterized protein LOC121739279 [Aricia agestis]
MSAYNSYEPPNPYFESNDTYNYAPVIPIVPEREVGDFRPFYITIAICSIILGFIIILNIVCCCSRYSDYWLDRHTGNRWLVSVWTATPHKQPPLDLTELESQVTHVQYVHPYHSEQYQEVRLTEAPASISRQPLTASQEFLELHKRESDI